tara:strand:+ start:722 stop:1525 length:804 start_codon:yes stop_codon:yes gene_type:complete
MRQKSPLVSIVVNCHNGEKYLHQCIKSIINQTYQKWELIFWDNSSSDNSLKILNSYKDKRIKKFKSKIFHNLYEARNLAIKKCKGKYICFLDVDDMWLKNKLKLQIDEALKDTSIKILYTNYYVFLNDKNKKFIKFSKKLNSGFITQKLLNSYDLGLATVMVDKKLFKERKFNGSYNVIGDFDYFLSSSLKYKTKALQEPLAIYRIHDENFSSKKTDIYINELSNWLKINNNKKKFKSFSFNSIYILLFKLKIKFYIKKILNIKLGV